MYILTIPTKSITINRLLSKLQLKSFRTRYVRMFANILSSKCSLTISPLTTTNKVTQVVPIVHLKEFCVIIFPTQKERINNNFPAVRHTNMLVLQNIIGKFIIFFKHTNNMRSYIYTQLYVYIHIDRFEFLFLWASRNSVCMFVCVCLDLNCVFLGANKTKIQHLLASNTPHRGGHRLRVRNKADTLNFFQLNERRGIVQNVPKAKERFLQLEFLAKQRKKEELCSFLPRSVFFESCDDVWCCCF